jgi:hypothetical protein
LEYHSSTNILCVESYCGDLKLCHFIEEANFKLEVPHSSKTLATVYQTT